jgi:hypothetical protein
MGGPRGPEHSRGQNGRYFRSTCIKGEIKKFASGSSRGEVVAVVEREESIKVGNGDRFISIRVGACSGRAERDALLEEGRLNWMRKFTGA